MKTIGKFCDTCDHAQPKCCVRGMTYLGSDLAACCVCRRDVDCDHGLERLLERRQDARERWKRAIDAKDYDTATRALVFLNAWTTLTWKTRETVRAAGVQHG